MQTWSKLLACATLIGLAGVGVWSLGPAAAEPPKADKPGGYVAVPLARLRRPAPLEYTLDANDVLGIYIEGVLGARDNVPVLNLNAGQSRLAVGVPVPVMDDGTINLPLVDSLRVRGTSLNVVREQIRDAYTSRGIMVKGKDRVLVTLAQPRTYAVTVVRLATGATTAVELPAFDNDVFTALVKSGNFMALSATNTLVIHRRRPRGTNDNQQTTIRLVHKSGEPLPFKPEDIVLESGDVVVIEGVEPAKP